MGVLGAAEASAGAARYSARPVAFERRWDLGFAGLLFYLIVEYTRLPAMFPVLQPLQLGKVAIGMAALGWLLGSGRSAGSSPKSQGVDLAFVAFLFVSAISFAFAPYKLPAWDTLTLSLIWFVVYFLVSRVVNSGWRLKIFIFLLLLLNLKLAQFGIREYRSGIAAGYSDMQIYRLGGAGGGSTGFFANAADFGVGMCVAFPIAALLLFSRLEKWRRLGRIFLGICAAAFLVAALVCESRGAVVGVVAIALIAWAKSPKKLVGAFLMVGLVGAVLMFVLPGATGQRMRTAWNDYSQDENAKSRVQLWKVGMRMFADHPLFGVGPGNFAQVRATQYWDVEAISGGAFVAHSVYVQTLAELGLAGAIPNFVAWILLFRINARTRKHLVAKRGEAARRSFEYCLAQGLDLALVGYLVTGAFVSVLYYPHPWILLGLTIGLNQAANQTEAGKAISGKAANATRDLAPAYPLSR